MGGNQGEVRQRARVHPQVLLPSAVEYENRAFHALRARSLFWKQEMEITLVGLQNAGKSTLVNVIAVRDPYHSCPCDIRCRRERVGL